MTGATTGNRSAEEESHMDPDHHGIGEERRTGPAGHRDRDPRPDPGELRIGDAEREQTMADLREHFALGRLDHAELDERLDRTLAARTARDLAEVTADLPGPGYRPGHHEPVAPGPGDWRAAVNAHRHQMETMRRHHPRRGPHGHGPHPHGPHRHGGPWLPILFGMMFVGMVAGGWGVVKVLFVIWLGAMVFSMLRRRFHHRG
ncbi:DUF1707 SHOCT-like domain-containing protein [Nonomuraea muscovyensis]|uniref:DUF1707 SHOCT-like domain-containing protein n=1 Tax=Nonomuraea muscovyensis TaxID=1124761 RepID=UPI0033F124E2|nr:hypothetical protein [Nonomuraea muscovyensis]